MTGREKHVRKVMLCLNDARRRLRKAKYKDRVKKTITAYEG